MIRPKDTLLKEVMTTSLKVMKDDEYIIQADRICNKYLIHHIPIVDDEGSLVGILSSTDIDRLKLGASFFKNPNKAEYTEAFFTITPVSEVMTRDIISLRSTDTVWKAYEIFLANTIRAIPILEEKKLVGIVTPIDLLKYCFEE